MVYMSPLNLVFTKTKTRQDKARQGKANARHTQDKHETQERKHITRQTQDYTVLDYVR